MPQTPDKRDERPIKTRLKRLDMTEEDAADLVALVFRIAEEERQAAREQETHPSNEAA